MRSEWNTSQLGDLAKFIDYRGKTPPKQTYGIPLITAKIIKENRIQEPQEFIADDFYDEWMRRGIPNKGDVIFTTEAPLGEVALIKTQNKQAFAQRIIILQAKSEILNNTFLFYSLQYSKIKSRIEARSSGTTVFGIKSAELKKVEIDYPPISVQHAIVSILSSLDDKIELNNKINANLEVQLQAIFKSWFVDFEPFQNSEFVDSELGRIPKGWQVGKLSELINIKYGKDHKKLADGDIPVYGSGGVMRFVERALYEKESVLIPRKGTLNNVIYINEPFWTVDTMFYSEMIKSHIAKYVYFFVNSKDLASMNAGSAVPSMTTEILNNIPVVIPSDEILLKYDIFATSVFNMISNKKKQNKTLGAIRDALLPKLMSGEIEVPISNEDTIEKQD